jgi:hypothetical protein
MSTSKQIRSIWKTEQRYPPDLVHNGRQYQRSSVLHSNPLRRAIRRVQEIQTRTA